MEAFQLGCEHRLYIQPCEFVLTLPQFAKQIISCMEAPWTRVNEAVEMERLEPVAEIGAKAVNGDIWCEIRDCSPPVWLLAPRCGPGRARQQILDTIGFPAKARSCVWCVEFLRQNGQGFTVAVESSQSYSPRCGA